MKQLSIKIKSQDRVVTFSGDTFFYKDLIKSLGKCRWDGASKTWIVSELLISKEKILEIFPGAEVVSSVPEEQAHSQISIINSPGSKSVFEEGSLSVNDLLASIKRVLQVSFSNTIRVFGVLNSVKHLGGSGRVYFDLLDGASGEASIRCVLWESNKKELKKFSDLGLGFEDNTPILMEASVSFNSKNGQVSLAASRFFPEYTLGKLQAQRDKTNEMLKAEKLFWENSKKTLPFLPRILGILTSDSGTVINDFMASLEVCKFGFKLLWFPVRVQGVNAEKDILDGIKYFQERMEVEAILIFRGGGSATELSIFNSYAISKEICLSRLPVLSAIGHEHDQCSAQDVSFKAFGVPKDIGRFLSDIVISRKEDLKGYGIHLSYEFRKIAMEAENSLSMFAYHLLKQSKLIFQEKMRLLKNSIEGLRSKSSVLINQSDTRLFRGYGQVLASANAFFSKQESRVGGLTNLLSRSLRLFYFNTLVGLGKTIGTVSSKVDFLIKANGFLLNSLTAIFKRAEEFGSAKSVELSYLEATINSFSPAIQLSRGYAILRNIKTGNVISSVADLRSEKVASIEMRDGLIDICTDEVKKGEI